MGTDFSEIMALKSFSDLISSLMEDEMEFSDALSSTSKSCISTCLLCSDCLFLAFFFDVLYFTLFLADCLCVSTASFSSWNLRRLNSTSA